MLLLGGAAPSSALSDDNYSVYKRRESEIGVERRNLDEVMGLMLVLCSLLSVSHATHGHPSWDLEGGPGKLCVLRTVYQSLCHVCVASKFHHPSRLASRDRPDLRLKPNDPLLAPVLCLRGVLLEKGSSLTLSFSLPGESEPRRWRSALSLSSSARLRSCSRDRSAPPPSS